MNHYKSYNHVLEIRQMLLSQGQLAGKFFLPPTLDDQLFQAIGENLIARVISRHSKYGKVQIAYVAYVVRGPSSPKTFSIESGLVRHPVHHHTVTCVVCCKGT